MNSRRVKICFLILDDRSKDLKSLSDRFKVTNRTIRNDIDEINRILYKNDLGQIQLNSDGSLDFKEDKKKVYNFLDNLNYYEYSLDREERCIVMAVSLLISKDYITLSDFADFMFVSRSTIVKDLDLLKEFLESYSYRFESQPSKGVRSLENSKENVAKLCMHLVNEDLNGIIRYFNQESSLDIDLGKYENFYQIKNEIEQAIRDAEFESHSFLTKHSFLVLQNFLTLYLISVAHEGVKIPEIKGEKFESILIEKLFERMGPGLDKTDISCIKDQVEVLNFSKKVYSEMDILKTQIVTRKFIESVSSELKINLNNEYEFFESLSNHLSSIINDPINKIEEYSGVIEYVKNYKSLIKVVRNNIGIIEKFTGRKLNDVEVYFIVIYIITAIEKKKNEIVDFRLLVICAEGVGISYLVKEKIRKILPDSSLEISSIYNYREEIEKFNPDLVVSTVSIDYDGDYIKISPFLDLEDKSKLLKKVDEIKLKKIMTGDIDRAKIEERHIHDMSELSKFPKLRDFLPIDLIDIGVEANDWKEAVEKSARPLIEYGYVEKDYIGAVIKNIENHGPYIVVSKGFAIPHASSDKGVINPGMSLIKLKEPVDFGSEKNDPIEFVACLAPMGNIHIRAFFNLVNGLQNEEIRDELFNSKSVEEIYETLKKID